MSLEPRFRSEKLCLMWSVKRPCCYRESPVFTLRGCEYKVSLRSDCHGYDMQLLRADEERIISRPFDTTVCIVFRSAEYLKQKAGVFNYNTSIWSVSISEVSEHLPEFEEEQFLLFRMIFSTGDSVHFCTSDFLLPRPVTGDKSVQTPIYWEIDPCLSLDFGRLLDGQADPKPDVEFKCGDNVTIRAHGSVLGARSEVFSRLLQTYMVEGKTGQVKIEGMEPGYFAEFIKYVYTGTLPALTVGLAMALYDAGDRCAVRNLTPRCAEFLSENMTPEVALECLAMADANSDWDFKEKAMAYVLDQNIPLQDDRWLPFSNEHPKIAAEVLLRFFKLNRRE